MAEVKKRGRPPKKKDELVELKNENTKEKLKVYNVYLQINGFE